MTRRLVPAVVLATLAVACVLLLARAAEGASASPAPSPEPVAVSLSGGSRVVTGRPVTLRATLRDDAGRPVSGVILRLVQRMTFLGRQHDVVLDEATTDQDGRAELSFSPDRVGEQTVVVRFDGTTELGSAEARVSFDVHQPIVAYHQAPLGVGGPWARSYLILIPLLGVWFTYAMAMRQARRVWRAGGRRGSVPLLMETDGTVPA